MAFILHLHRPRTIAHTLQGEHARRLTRGIHSSMNSRRRKNSWISRPMTRRVIALRFLTHPIGLKETGLPEVHDVGLEASVSKDAPLVTGMERTVNLQQAFCPE